MLSSYLAGIEPTHLRPCLIITRSLMLCGILSQHTQSLIDLCSLRSCHEPRHGLNHHDALLAFSRRRSSKQLGVNKNWNSEHLLSATVQSGLEPTITPKLGLSFCTNHTIHTLAPSPHRGGGNRQKWFSVPLLAPLPSFCPLLDLHTKIGNNVPP